MNSMAGEAMAMADKAAGALVLAVTEEAILETGDLAKVILVTATAGREVLPQEALRAALATSRRTEVIRRIKVGATTKAPRITATPRTMAPRDLEKEVTLARAVALGTAVALVRAASLERAGQALLATIGDPIPTRVPTTGALRTRVTRDLLAITGALEVTRDLLVVGGDLATRTTKALLAMVGAQETTRALEALTRETVAKAALATTRAVDGKSFIGICLSEMGN